MLKSSLSCQNIGCSVAGWEKGPTTVSCSTLVLVEMPVTGNSEVARRRHRALRTDDAMDKLPASVARPQETR